jgi:hypothetical protein
MTRSIEYIHIDPIDQSSFAPFCPKGHRRVYRANRHHVWRLVVVTQSTCLIISRLLFIHPLPAYVIRCSFLMSV